MIKLKRNPKPTTIKTKSDLRRQHFFEKQLKYRREFLDSVRDKAINCLYEAGSQPTKTTYQNFQFLADQLMQYDFLVDIPTNLSTEWYVYCRVEGQRVLLVTEGYLGCLISRSEGLIKTFKTAIPTQGCIILDGIYVNSTCTKEIERIGKSSHEFVLITDCLSWNNYDLQNSTSECRQFLLRSRFDEIEKLVSMVTSQNEYAQMYEATSANIKILYNSQPRFGMLDGLIFIKRDSIYTPGLSPFFLLWRDLYNSKYPINTSIIDEQVRVSDKQIVNLKLRFSDGALLTQDNIRVGSIDPKKVYDILSKLPNTIYILKWKRGLLKSSILVRAYVNKLFLKITETESNDCLMDVEIFDTPSPKRKVAESLNKIIHQYLLRNNMKYITLAELMYAADTGKANQEALFMANDVHVESFLDSSDTEFPEYC